MAKLVDSFGRPHSGQVSHPVVALATDNADPDELGRVQGKFATMPEEALPFWLRKASPKAGEDRGLYSTPEV
ncbi:MAG: phage baseplate assembly protein V, partial [Myxococcota bacterium]